MTGSKPHPNVFSHKPIDRHGLKRRDAEWLAALPPDMVRVLPVAGGLVALAGEGAETRLAFSPDAGLPAGQRIFLGMNDGIAYCTAVLRDAPDGIRFEDLRKVAGVLPADEAGLAAYALGLARWHERSGFCGVCGTATLVTEAGHKRVCPNPACAAEHFPRTDPAIIVLVENGDACLLARNARHRPGMHSTLAGFVEPGESLEAALVREVFEEAAVIVTGISYHSSQPWPFPASLMVGFHATTDSREFKVDGEEIVAGGWFTRADLKPYIEDGAVSEEFGLPGRLSISWRLIEDWYYSVAT